MAKIEESTITKSDIYQCLVDAGPGTPKDVAGRLDQDDIEGISSALSDLQSIGLITQSPWEFDSYRAHPPQQAFVHALGIITERLHADAAIIRTSAQLANVSTSSPPDEGFTRISDRDEYLDRIGQIAMGASESLYSLLPLTPSNKELESAVDFDLLCLESGIPIRSIYPDDARLSAGVREYYEKTAPFGGQIRTTIHPTINLRIVDRTTVIIDEITAPREISGIITREPVIVGAMVLFFDLLWDQSPPLVSNSGLSQREEHVIALLSEGLTEKAIAARLNRSHRVVTEVVRNLKETAGVNSMFALGCEAERRGWLGKP
ncbi:MAG: helix-turn-helix domain-containing protein [Cellulomonadaceae bacterium]|jgi:predicted transcriptional regulator|nr:helix-turn-helix domain-containing protein [Cellulomonadaceae bacterium]